MKTSESETNELLDYIAESTKNVKETPMDAEKVYKDYLKKKNREQTAENVENVRKIVLKLLKFKTDGMSCSEKNTKVKMLYALGIPVNADLLKELEKFAYIKLGPSREIVDYVAGNGSLALGEKKITCMNKPELFDFFAEFIKEHYQQTMNLRELAAVYKMVTGDHIKVRPCADRISAIRPEILNNTKLSIPIRIKMLFVMRVEKVDAKFLEFIRETARVEIDKYGRIIEYVANDGCLRLSSTGSSEDVPPEVIREDDPNDLIFDGGEFPMPIRLKIEPYDQNPSFHFHTMGDFTEPKEEDPDEMDDYTMLDSSGPSTSSNHLNPTSSALQKPTNRASTAGRGRPRTWDDFRQKSIQFLADFCSNRRTPVELIFLARRYKEVSKDKADVTSIITRFKKLRPEIHQWTQFDMNTRIRMLYVTKAKLDPGFIEEIRKSGKLQLGLFKRVFSYQANDGSLKLGISDGSNAPVDGEEDVAILGNCPMPVQLFKPDPLVEGIDYFVCEPSNDFVEPKEEDMDDMDDFQFANSTGAPSRVSLGSQEGPSHAPFGATSSESTDLKIFLNHLHCMVLTIDSPALTGIQQRFKSVLDGIPEASTLISIDNAVLSLEMILKVVKAGDPEDVGDQMTSVPILTVLTLLTSIAHFLDHPQKTSKILEAMNKVLSSEGDLKIPIKNLRIALESTLLLIAP